MSSSSANQLFALLDRSVPAAGESLLAPIRGIAFWSAIALPFLYIPLLVSGLGSASTRTAFVALVACNVVALLIGHSHRRG